MKKSTIIIIAVVAIVLLFCMAGGVTACSAYNNMVSESEQVDKAWANVNSSYQRRLDMIPNLVNTVKGYAKHEKQTLAEVTAMRAGDKLVAAANDAQGFAGPDGETPSPEKFANLDHAYGVYINAVHEAYPQLMASQNFLDLQAQIEGTENRINVARDRYNESVQQYNVRIRRFPNNIFASMFGFNKKQMFQADAEASRAPQVSFDE